MKVVLGDYVDTLQGHQRQDCRVLDDSGNDVIFRDNPKHDGNKPVVPGSIEHRSWTVPTLPAELYAGEWDRATLITAISDVVPGDRTSGQLYVVQGRMRFA